MAEASRDNNRIPTLLAVSSSDGTTPVTLYADPTTHRLLVDAAQDLGDLSDVTITSAATGDILYRNGDNDAWVNLAIGSEDEVLTVSASGIPEWTSAVGGGDFSGPGSSTDNAIVRFDGTGGKTGQNSVVTIADTTGVIAGTEGITISGTTSGTTAVVATAVAGTTTLTLPAATDTLVGKATTDTLTNKTIDADNNTISNLAVGSEVDTDFGASAITNIGNITGVAGGITISTATNGNVTLDPGGSGTTTVNAGSGGVTISTDAGNADIDLSPHGTGVVNLAASTDLAFNNTAILSDSAGTMTLSNIDALDATTESTIEAVIDTLSNLTSVGTITTGTWSADLAADTVDAITEIASAIKSGADATLVTGTAGTNGNIAEWNGDGDLVDSGNAVGDFLQNVVEDTSPQLGGSLDVNGNKIVSTANGDIDIEPNGTGNVLLGNLTFDADQTVGAGQDDYVLTYDNGTGLISLEAAAAAGIGGSTGGTDNAVLRADGTGGSTLQASAVSIDDSGNTSGVGTLNSLTLPASNFVGLTDTQTLTNKTLTTPVISTISNTGTLTLPTSTDTLVGRDTTDTLTNKTLTSPTISGGTITGITDITVADGGTGVSSLTAYAPVFGGTTSTGAVQSGTVGTSGQVLTSNGAGALPTFQDAAGGGGSSNFASAYKSANQSGIGTSATKITFPNENFDTGGDFDSATNYRYTAPSAGKYMVTAHIRATNITNTDYHFIYLYKNGTAIQTFYSQTEVSAGTSRICNIATVVDLTTSDYLELYTESGDSSYSITGGTAASGNRSEFQIYKIA